MTKVAAFAVFFRVPVIGQFNLGIFIAWRRQKYQRKTALFTFTAAQFNQSELKIQRMLQIAHTNHGMQILHKASPCSETI
jgi:hypothetical protein